MKAIGHDGRWHPWGELTAEEQREWMEAMTKADEIHDMKRRGECAPTLAQNLARHELNKRFVY